MTPLTCDIIRVGIEGAREKLLPFLLTNTQERGIMNMAKYVSPTYERIQNSASKGKFFVRLAYGVVDSYMDTKPMTTQQVIEEFLDRNGVKTPKEFFDKKFRGVKKANERAQKPLIKPNVKNNWGFAAIQGEHSYYEDAKNTNPKYSRFSWEYSNNCQRCCPAFEMRRRGFDVQALPRLRGDDRVAKEWQNIFENATWEKVSSRTTIDVIQEIKDKLISWGNGARAEIYILARSGRSAHVFMVENVNGSANFIDPQDPTRTEQFLFSSIQPTKTLICRTDNLKPTDLIKECCK